MFLLTVSALTATNWQVKHRLNKRRNMRSKQWKGKKGRLAPTNTCGNQEDEREHQEKPSTQLGDYKIQEKRMIQKQYQARPRLGEVRHSLRQIETGKSGTIGRRSKTVYQTLTSHEDFHLL